jgi:hypothetical protein
MSLNYIGLIAPTIRAVQEMKAENDNAFARLKTDNDSLRRQLKAANDNYLELKREVDAVNRSMGRSGRP